MSAANLSLLSKTPPMPNTTNCGGAPISYTCHAAVLHWTAMDQGKNQADANFLVTRVTRAVCPGCNNPGSPHSSIVAHRYGSMFCCSAQRILRNQLHTHLHPGDVLITGHPSMPNHSMIVRQVAGPNHVTVRGFNNIGTLGTGGLLQYDPVSHNITKDKYWKPNDMFGAYAPGIQLYYIPYATYSMQMARVVSMLNVI